VTEPARPSAVTGDLTPHGPAELDDAKSLFDLMRLAARLAQAGAGAE